MMEITRTQSVDLPFVLINIQQGKDQLEQETAPIRRGALCPACYAQQKRLPAIVALSPWSLWFLQECQRGPYSRLRTQHYTPALHAEAERVMHHYVTYHLERGVRSGTFLQRLKREHATGV